MKRDKRAYRMARDAWGPRGIADHVDEDGT